MWSQSGTGRKLAFVTYVGLVVALVVVAQITSRYLTTFEDFVATYSMLCTLLLVSVQGFILAAVAHEEDAVRAFAWIATLLLVAAFGGWVATSMPGASSHSKAVVFAGFVFGGLITILADAMNSAPADRQARLRPPTG